MSVKSPLAWGVVIVLGLVTPLSAKTVVLTDADCDRMAAICADAPRLSWAGYEPATGVYDATVNEGWVRAYPDNPLSAILAAGFRHHRGLTG